MAGETPDAALRAASAPIDETTRAAAAELAETARLLAQDHEIPALLRALDGRFIAPVAGGDLMRTPAILPTGRNLHGFDPYRIPSAYALADGRRQAERVLARYREDHSETPETVAVVLWGADNLKSEGGPIAQALALIGAKPRFDAYGRLCGAELLIRWRRSAARASTWSSRFPASSATCCRCKRGCSPKRAGWPRRRTSPRT